MEKFGIRTRVRTLLQVKNVAQYAMARYKCVWMNKSERAADYLLRSLRKANRTYGLIAEGDRIAVGVSGGKDSQTLIRLLHRWQSYAPMHFDLVAVHVSMEEAIPEATDIQQYLQDLFSSLKIPFSIRPIELASNEPKPLSCFRCSWNRRKTLFLAAHDLDCNKVALAHHANDITETGLLNLFFHGRLESMAPRQEMFDGEITLIRPLALIEEKDIVYYARSAGFWKESVCCQHAQQSKRAKMKTLLREAQAIAPRAQINLFRAIERSSHWRQI